MPQQLSRRSVAKSAAWGMPALAIAAAAPAMAQSCTPTTVSTTSALHWVSSQTSFNSPDGDPEFHGISYVFTNSGPDALPAGVPVTLTIAITVLSGEEAQVDVQSTDKATATVANSSVDDPASGTTTDTATVSIRPSQSIPVGGSFTVDIMATYGVLTNVDEQASTQSPATVTDDATCTTYVVSSTIDGASNGTSYTSPP